MSSGLLAGAVGPAVEDFQAGSEVDAGRVRFCACVSFDELVRGCSANEVDSAADRETAVGGVR